MEIKNKMQKETLVKSRQHSVYILEHFSVTSATSVTSQIMEIYVMMDSVFQVHSATLGGNKRPVSVLNEKIRPK